MTKIIKPKQQTVYKVCREENGKFFSLHALGYLRHEYAIGQTTRPKPELAKRKLWLYAYDDKSIALKTNYDNLAIFKCLSDVVIFECLSDEPKTTYMYNELYSSPQSLKEIKKYLTKFYCCLSPQTRNRFVQDMVLGHTYITPQKIIWRNGEAVSPSIKVFNR